MGTSTDSQNQSLRVDGGGVILLYHRVAELASDPQLLSVSPENFAAHLAILRELAIPKPLAALVTDAGGKSAAGKRAVTLTFDDGYADNLLHAKPLLERFQIPATVFVSTAGIGSTREFFWDELGRIFLEPGHLPERLELCLDGAAVYTADLGTAADYTQAQYEQYRHWNVILSETPTSRQRIYNELCTLLHKSPLVRRHQLLTALLAWSGLQADGRATHRLMTAEQLRELTRGGLIEIGGHTVHHPLLAVEEVAVQRAEIWLGRDELVKVLGRMPVGFSYPFGCRRDYTAESIKLVREAGFGFACSNFNGVVEKETDRYQLPRVLVRNWSGEEFTQRMGRWF